LLWVEIVVFELDFPLFDLHVGLIEVSLGVDLLPTSLLEYLLLVSHNVIFFLAFYKYVNILTIFLRLSLTLLLIILRFRGFDDFGLFLLEFFIPFKISQAFSLLAGCLNEWSQAWILIVSLKGLCCLLTNGVISLRNIHGASFINVITGLGSNQI